MCVMDLKCNEFIIHDTKATKGLILHPDQGSHYQHIWYRKA